MTIIHTEKLALSPHLKQNKILISDSITQFLAIDQKNYSVDLA